MSKKQGYRCKQIARCPLAARREVILLAEGEAFKCPIDRPGCRADLEPVAPPAPFPWPVLVGVAVLVIAALAVWFALRGNKHVASGEANPTPQPTPDKSLVVTPHPTPATPVMPATPVPTPTPPPPAPPPPPTTQVLLRIATTATLADELLAPLTASYLSGNQKLESVVQSSDASSRKLQIRGQQPGRRDLAAVEIAKSSPAEAFNALAAGRADLVVSPRAPEDPELQALKPLGDFRRNECEHVLALDGLAVLVHKRNQLAALSTRQVRSILEGTSTTWAQVGGDGAGIRLHLPEENTAEFEMIRGIIGARPSGSARHYGQNRALADGVAADVDGFGIAPLRDIRNAKAIEVGDQDVEKRLPGPFTVARESYAFRNRIFLYHPAAPTNPHTLDFVSFVLSAHGQELVGRTGFIDQNIKASPALPLPENLANALPANVRAAIKATQPVGTSFYFEYDSSALDTRAVEDIRRFERFLTEPQMQGKGLLLFGFTDARGTDAYNLKLSQDRARTVEIELLRRDIHPVASVGVGKQMPVASNDTEEGQKRNRRVEVWTVELK
jgi:phosphate transport system substrate-binding protein